MPATRMPETIFFAVTKGAKKKHFNIWAQTQMAHSAETEVALFQNIANPEKTSTSPRPAHPSSIPLSKTACSAEAEAKQVTP